MAADSTFIRRVVLKNYKSIAACNVTLGPLTFLVGHNGSGKSNFLDALRFVADSLRYSLEHALRDRGGIAEVRRRSSGHPNHFSIRLEFVLRDGSSGSYSFRVGARAGGGYEVQNEECAISQPDRKSIAKYAVQSGQVSGTLSPPPAASSDRLYLVNASGFPEFRPLYDALSRMGFYNLNPDRIRDLQSPDPGELLTRDGSNLASVLDQMARHHADSKRRLEEYLAQVVPGIEAVDTIVVGPKETLEFKQKVAGADNAWRFHAASMSDGTLRALGVLVSLFQSGNGGGGRVSLVGIEEPEIALHPSAALVLLDGLRDACGRVQVIVTSHSGDLLDDDELPLEAILAVEAGEGTTRIAPIDAVGRTAMKDHLYTAGHLLRLGQLQPDPTLFDNEA